jgi:hypothetical protein
MVNAAMRIFGMSLFQAIRPRPSFQRKLESHFLVSGTGKAKRFQLSLE